MRNMKMTKMFTIVDVARRIGIAPVTVRKWIAKGEAPPYIRVGRTIRFRLEDVEAWETAQSRLGSAASASVGSLPSERKSGPAERREGAITITCSRSAAVELIGELAVDRRVHSISFASATSDS
jgi:excisionase family DNA binding protein